MKKILIAMAGLAGVVAATSASAGTLEDVRARGHLNCIVNTGLTGLRAQMMRATGQASTLNSVALLPLRSGTQQRLNS